MSCLCVGVLMEHSWWRIPLTRFVGIEDKLAVIVESPHDAKPCIRTHRPYLQPETSGCHLEGSGYL